MTPREQFAAAVHELIAQTKQLPPEARARVLELLDHARTQILGRLVSIDPDSFSYAQLTSLKQSIEQAMDDFRRDVTRVVEDLQRKAAQLGSAGAAQPLVSAGLEAVALGRVNPTTLSIVQGYSADLITNLSRQAAHQINSAIQRAFLGGQSMTDIVQQIGRGLGAKGKVSLFDSIGERATVIADNEILRVHAMSTQARLEEMSERHPDLKKQWKHLPAAKIPRVAHVLADGQIRNVSEPFEIAPYPDAVAEKLMFPRDPIGTPQNTINCHCLSVPYFAPEDLKPTGDHRSLLEKLGISISAA